jgi:hypothetical protein
MNLLRRVFGRGKPIPLAPLDAAALDEAIVRASRGELPVRELLDLLYPALVYVPLAAEPRISAAGVLEAWKPATVSKPEVSTSYLAAFTSRGAIQKFMAQSPAYTYVFQTTTEYALNALARDHGVVFNVGSTSGFEWSPSGIATYLAETGSSSAR